MFLARCLAEHPCETRAGLQRWFGLDLDDMGGRFTSAHAACCVAMMPLGSRLMAAIDPRATWGATEWKLHEIASMLSRKPIPLPWERASGGGGAGGGADAPTARKLPLGRARIEDFRKWYEETEWEDCDGGERV